MFAEGLNGTPQSAFQVERSRFDHLLLQQAEARGAKVRHGVKVADMTVEDDAVRVETSGGTFRARFMIDATGQDAFLARANRTVQPLKGFGCVAVFRHYDGIAPEIFDELTVTGNIKILMVPDGWMWLIPLAGPRLSVGIVSRNAISSTETLDRAIAASPITQRLIAGAVGTEARIIRNFSYRNQRSYGRRWGCAGDASCFLDPVFSSGVSLAMLSAESVAEKLSAALRAGTEDDPELLAAHADPHGDRLPQLRGDRVPLLSRGAGPPSLLPGHRGRAACGPGSPACWPPISGATTISSSRCCCARSARKPGRREPARGG